MQFDFDSEEFERDMNSLANKADQARQDAQQEVADELLRLSQFEVPHGVSTLQNTGHTGTIMGQHYVGYGGPGVKYAARLHENPQYRFQKGRKGKYLEDPLKKNLRVFQKHMAEGFAGAIS